MRLRKLIAAGAVVGGVVAGGLVTAAPASAATLDYDCQDGQVCLYYNSSSYGYGAVYIQQKDIPNYAGYYFSTSENGSSGAGVSVKNHAAAVDSWLGVRFRVYYNSGYDCSVHCQTVAAYDTVNLNSYLKNENASGQALAS